MSEPNTIHSSLEDALALADMARREVASLRAELAAEKERSARLAECYMNSHCPCDTYAAGEGHAPDCQWLDVEQMVKTGEVAALLRRREAEQAIIDAARDAIAEPEYWALRREPLDEALAALAAETGEGK